MKIQIIQADITTVAADAIVNAANSSLLGGGGVDGAIHRKGGLAILDECRDIVTRQGGCWVGQAVMTTAGNLPAKKVIHTVGPVWNGGSANEEYLLRSCYEESLKIAEEYKLTSIAFPNISTGIYRFPKEMAAQVAFKVIHNWTSDYIEEIIFVCYDDENYSIYEKLRTLY